MSAFGFEVLKSSNESKKIFLKNKNAEFYADFKTNKKIHKNWFSQNSDQQKSEEDFALLFYFFKGLISHFY